jgi:hypothetical protein
MSAEAPRRSPRIAADLAVSDGDTWYERIAVCESATTDGRPKLLVRSYYRSSRTHEKVWDEPPSGASRVEHATPEMRTKAELQLQELQLTLEMIPDEEGAEDSKNKQKKKKKGLFGRFRKKEKKELADSQDLNLQKAIARSMADHHGAGGADGGPVVYFDTESPGEDDAVTMAKAMSMSESAAAHDGASMSEEEMLRRALEESRLDAHRNGVPDVASVPDPYYVPDEDLDRKMPIRAFDPYAAD